MATQNAPTIQQAMAAVMNDVRGVGKHGRNQQQNFSFRGIDDVLNAVGPALRTHGVFLAPCVGDYSTDVVEVGQKRTPMKSVTVVVAYTFHGPAGDSVTSTVIGEAMDSGDKAFSKAMSVALRTALIQTLALPTDEKDPDHDTYERAPRGQQGAPLSGPLDPAEQRGTQPQRNGAQATADVSKPVAGVLTAKNSDALTWWKGKVDQNGDGDTDATPHITQDDREALGLDEGVTLTVSQLVNRVAGYVDKYGSGPRHATQAGAVS